MRLATSFAVALLTLLVAGCSSETGDNADSAPESGDADCARGVLFKAREYVERGFVDQAGKAIGSGSMATCDDTGADSQGLVFRDDGERVEVWSLTEVPRSDAVAIKVGANYAALLNEELSKARRAEIVEDLGLDE